jgi:hypothetical protein
MPRPIMQPSIGLTSRKTRPIPSPITRFRCSRFMTSLPQEGGPAAEPLIPTPPRCLSS